MSQESETRSKNDDQMPSMPPPPSPNLMYDATESEVECFHTYYINFRRRRHPSTPKGDQHFPQLRSPGSQEPQDIFSNDQLTDCRALPSHLFSPARQAQLLMAGDEGAGHHHHRAPRYQDIPLTDYASPRSVEPPGLERFLMSPAPSPGQPPPSPGHPSQDSWMMPPPASPGQPSQDSSIMPPPPSPGHLPSESIPPPASPRQTQRLVPSVSHNIVKRLQSQAVPTSEAGQHTVAAVEDSLETFGHKRGDRASSTRLLEPPSPFPSSPCDTSSDSLPSLPSPERPSKKPRSLNDGIEMLARKAMEGEQNGNISRSEIFRRMNELVNEASGDEEYVPDNNDSFDDDDVNDNMAVSTQHPGRVQKKVFMKKRKIPPTPDNIAEGSWRFTIDNPDPHIKNVSIKNISKIRRMLHGEDCDKVTINIKPMVETLSESEKPKKSHTKKEVKAEETTAAPGLPVKTESKIRGRFFCPDCGFRCKIVSEIKNHPCKSKVPCDDCSELFDKRKDLMEHIRMNHPYTGGERLNCAYCKRAFTTKTMLNEHLRLKHPVQFYESSEVSSSSQGQRPDENENLDVANESSNIPGDLDDLDLLENLASSVQSPDDGCSRDEEDIDELLTLEDLANSIEEEDEDDEDYSVHGSRPGSQTSAGAHHLVDCPDEISITPPPLLEFPIIPSGSEEQNTPRRDTSASNEYLESPPVKAAIPNNLLSVEGDIDAPDSVRSLVSQSREEETTRSDHPKFLIKPTSAYRCGRCGKKFNTSIRFNNHQKNCRAVGPAPPDDTDDPSAVPKPRSRVLKVRRKPNPRMEQLKSTWTDSLYGRERCMKCGRNNYIQDSLEKHMSKCQGTLLLDGGRGPRFECPYCFNPRKHFTTENAMRRHVGTSHAKEALDDAWDFKSYATKTMGLASNHLFK